jgi:hypothetical protein
MMASDTAVQPNGDIITQAELRILADAKMLADRISAAICMRITNGASVERGPIAIGEVTPPKSWTGKSFRELIGPWGNDPFLDISRSGNPRSGASSASISFRPPSDGANYLRPVSQ